MLEVFIKELKSVYYELVHKNNYNIEEFKKKWMVDASIGEVYQKLSKRELKKDMGSFYTPIDIVNYMVDESLKDLAYKKNPYMKILDPSCGGGYFLSAIYRKLKIIGCDIGIENIDKHIIENNIFGCDTDENAVMISVIEFFGLTGIVACNIVQSDYLIEYEGAFDIIIGNPPYMGHKVLIGDYRKLLQSTYSSVFYDKADMSYCFIKKCIDLLNPNGKLVFFTSRYILEASNGNGIRKYILENGFINSIIDFYGVRVVKGAGVDNIIFEFTRGNNIGSTEFYRIMQNGKGIGKKVFEDILNKKFDYVQNIQVCYETLQQSGFIFLSQIEASIINRINGTFLSNICGSFQGIITGCDKAFVLKEERARALGIEKDIIMPWIKSKNISPYNVLNSDEVIIYSELITLEEDYINSIKYIKKHYDKLIGRRECKSGIRKWYQLQWGRNLSLFLNKKIIFPYKASSNRFAIDSGNCFSADVYSIKIKPEHEESITYEFLVGILNSSLYEFYIKSIAKKLGDDLYDYYPNKIMTLIIPDYIGEIDEIVRRGGEGTREKIDCILNEYFNISEEEYCVIKSWCK